MGVEDNQFEIEKLSESQTFYEWFEKTNDEVIEKLNYLKVFDGASGDGISVSVGTTLSGTAGVMLVELSGNVTKGITFQDVTINGSLNYSFDSSDTKSVTRFIGNTAGFTFGNVVRIDYSTNDNGLTLARALNADEAEAIGLIGSMEGDTISVVSNGKIQGNFDSVLVGGGTLHGGCVYFVDPNARGKLTNVEPTTSTHISKPILVGITGDTGIVLNYRGQALGFTGATGSNIGTLRVYANVDNANNFEVGRFVAHNTSISDADGRDLEQGIYYASSNDPAPSNSDGPFRTDLLGMVVGRDTTNNILEILVRGFVSTNDIATDEGSLNSPFYLTSTDDGKSTNRRTDVQLGHKIDGNTSFIDPRINETDIFTSFTQRSFLSGGDGVSFGIQSTNKVINGSLDIWQRHIGTSSAFSGVTSSGSFYFADRWVVRNEIYSPTSGTFNVQRMSFDEGQTDVLGSPDYFARITNNYSGSSSGNVFHVENRLESSDTYLEQPSVVSVYAKSGVAGGTVDVYYNQYFDDGATEISTNIGQIYLYTSWTPYAFPFTVPGVTGAGISGTDHYASIAFDLSNIEGTYFDISQLQFELGYNPTVPIKQDKSVVLDRCRKFYQRSYDEEISTRSSTMIEDLIPDLSVVDIGVNYSKDYYYTFPVKMRKEPSVILYSPNSGVTAEGYNRLAQLDMRLTSGTVGPNGQTRRSRVNQPTIQVGNTADNGIRFEIVSGAVVGDQISVHYVADADINKNL